VLFKVLDTRIGLFRVCEVFSEFLQEEWVYFGFHCQASPRRHTYYRACLTIKHLKNTNLSKNDSWAIRLLVCCEQMIDRSECALQFFRSSEGVFE
jgi:hypothetical protein